jgi:hypothetical protein
VRRNGLWLKSSRAGDPTNDGTKKNGKHRCP